MIIYIEHDIMTPGGVFKSVFIDVTSCQVYGLPTISEYITFLLYNILTGVGFLKGGYPLYKVPNI